MKKALAPVSAALALLLAPTTSQADHDDVVTFGFGTHAGIFQSTSPTGPQSGAMTGFNGRARLGRAFAMQLTYDVSQLRSRQDLHVLAPAFELSGLVYIVPSSTVGAYLIGGVGAQQFGDLFKDGPSASYHLGLGMEVYIGRHFAVTGEFRFLVPGFTRTFVDVARQAIENAWDKKVYGIQAQAPDVWSRYNLSNYQVQLGVRYYL